MCGICLAPRATIGRFPTDSPIAHPDRAAPRRRLGLGRQHGPPRSPDRLRNGLASLAYSARFRISHDVGRLQIVCGPQRHLGRLRGTWGHHRLPPLADTSWAALQRRDQEPGPTPLIGLRAGCNGLIALLLGLLAV
jgi:hypothetical protein